MESIGDFKLAQSSELLKLSTSDDLSAVTLAMVSQGTRSLDIFSRDLDARIFDNLPFTGAVTKLAADSKYAKVRVLLMDDEPVVKRGHRLVDLARRLSSHIAVRIIHSDFKTYNQAFIILDHCGYIYRELSDCYGAEACFDDQAKARELVELFDYVWEHSQPSPNLRQLHI